MNASKENARKARQLFLALPEEAEASSPEDDAKRNEAEKFIEDFLVAAERKLPTEAAYAKEKARRKPTAKLKH